MGRWFKPLVRKKHRPDKIKLLPPVKPCDLTLEWAICEGLPKAVRGAWWRIVYTCSADDRGDAWRSDTAGQDGRAIIYLKDKNTTIL